MKVEEIAKLLDAHAIPYRIESGRIFADTMRIDKKQMEEVEDLTQYSRAELYDFLGYGLLRD